MHRKLLPALAASAVFLATVLNAAAAPLDPASASRYTSDQAALADSEVVALPTTALLQGLHTTSYTRLQQFLKAQGWFPGPQTQLLQLKAAAYDDLGYDIGGPVLENPAGQLAERAFDY
jgi:hypothetical protein